MNVALANSSLNAIAAPLVAVGAFADDARGEAFTAFDTAAAGRLSTIAAEEGFGFESGKTLLVHTPDLLARRVLVVGLGKRQDLDSHELRRFAAAAVEEAERRHLATVSVVVPSEHDTAAAVYSMTLGAELGAYRYTEWLTDPKEVVRHLETATLVVAGDVAAFEALRHKAVRAAEAICFARDIVNAPPVAMTPEILAEQAVAIARSEGLECVVFDEATLREKGMNLLAAVGGGSAAGPRFIHLTYRPEGADASTPQIALVGKGLTFDAGGYNIKPTGAIEDMKVDMAGAAAVFGAMKALKAFDVKVIVHGIVPSAENLVSHNAYKPGDVIRSHNGKTVEIMNTDAEGRLILADALSYAEKLGATRIVDLATLTGACMVALGPFTAGLFSNDDAFRAAIESAAKRAGEDLWSMPLSKKLKSMLKSPIADMKNIGERWGGAITGALFLQEFVGKATWAHLDIAGPATNDKPEPGVPRGATGYGILTLLELVSSHTSEA